MEQKEQTAVEWFAEQIIRKHPIITQYLPNYNFDKELIEQAKEMEKKQIIKAAQDNFYAGQDLANGYKIDWNSAEQYYNEEYGKNNQSI